MGNDAGALHSTGVIQRLLFQFYFVLFRLLAWWRPATPVTLYGRDFRRIMVFSAAGIGDTLTDSVAIRALKESFPRARLMVVTHRRRLTIAAHNPYVDEVIPYHKSLLRFVTLTRELRRWRPDVVVMLRGNDPDIWPLAWLANRHAIVSCPVMTRFGFLISHPVNIPEWDQTHGVEQTLKIIRSIGAEARDPRLVYRVSDEEKQRLEMRLAGMGIVGKPRVVFQVGGGRRSAWRDWPATYFATSGSRLLDQFDVHLVLLGGKDLRSKAAMVRQMLPAGVFNLAGELSLAESAALLTLSEVLVSTDTGVMHLGFAVGVETLALIHCNNPASRVGPYGYGKKHRVAELKPPPGVKPSKDVDMALLTPEDVWPLLKELCELCAQRSQRARR